MDRPEPHKKSADVPPMPERPTFIDPRGTVRFFPNRIVRVLLDAATARGAMDLNRIKAMADNSEFTEADLNEFYQLIGYSVSGYQELQPSDPDDITDPA